MANQPTIDRAGATYGEPFEQRRREGQPYTWVVQGRTRDGRRFQIKRSDPKSPGKAHLALLAAMEGKGSRTHDRLTMNELVESWTAKHEQRERDNPRGLATLAESTRMQYQDVWRIHLRETFGTRTAASITHAELADFFEDESRTIRPKYLLDALRSFFAHAEDRGIVTGATNPTRGRFGLTPTKPDPTVLTTAEIDEVEAHLATLPPAQNRTDALRLHDSFVVMRATGLRISEVLAIAKRSFDPETRVLRVEQHLTRSRRGKVGGNSYRVADGSKTPAGERVIQVPRGAAAILQERARGKKPDDYLFATAKGTPMSTQNWRSTFGREMEKINAERALRGEPELHVHPHKLRATVASTIVKAMVEKQGVAAGLQSARVQLGHKTIAPLVHYVTQEAVVEDHDDALDSLDAIAMRMRKVQGAFGRKRRYSFIEVALRGREVVVEVSDLLDAEQIAMIAERLREGGVETEIIPSAAITAELSENQRDDARYYGRRDPRDDRPF